MTENWNKYAMALAVISVLMIIGMGVLYFMDTDTPTVTKSTTGKIGVIDISGVIDTQEYTDIIIDAIDEAISDNEIKTVILRIDSPGGSAHLCEQIYLDTLELRKVKPVISSVSMALSGGYYIAVATDYMFCQPTSMVGNVGVIATGPGFLVPSETLFESGPHKVTGFSPLLFPFNITKALDSFAGAVEEGRGDKLHVPMNEVRRGSVYIGKEAVNLGLADEIGAHQAAVNHAASVSELDSFNIVYLVEEVLNVTTSNGAGSSYVSVDDLNKANPPPALYYLYMPGDIYMQEPDEDGEEEPETEPSEDNVIGQVIVDLSHENKVSPWILNLLMSELSKRDIYVGFSSEWEKIETALDQASCLIVANPTQYYSNNQYEAIKDFLRDGKMLILFYDPSSDFNELPGLNGYVNSLANHFDLGYGNGYLYDEENFYGFYRNIIIDDFREENLTEGLENIVLYTSTQITSSRDGVAFTDYDTYNSVSELAGRYATIATTVEGNGTIVAFGDITWLIEPYVYTEDNHQMALNLVEMISNIEILEE